MDDDLLQEPEEDKPGREVIIMLAVFFEVGLAPLSLLLGWLLTHPPLEHFVWSWNDAAPGRAGDRSPGPHVPGNAPLADRPPQNGQEFLRA